MRMDLETVMYLSVDFLAYVFVAWGQNRYFVYIYDCISMS